MTRKKVLVDSGTSYTKIHFMDSGEREVVPGREAVARLKELHPVACTGHNRVPGCPGHFNELVALAEGGLALIQEPDFTLLDCGARDVKYVKVKDRRVAGMDWNTECGAFTGQLIELLVRYFDIDTDLPPPVEADGKIPVVCGVLGMTHMFDLISQGETHESAFARFLRGIAFNCEHLVGRPERVYISGGLCGNRAFLNSFSVEARPLGRFVLLEGLGRMVAASDES